MPTEPFIVNLGASNHSLIRGCPGVPKTCPRVESVLEIRSKDGGSFAIKTIILELNTLQSVSVPSTAGISSNDAHRAYGIFKDTIYNSEKLGSEKVLGMDLPFVIPINKDIISSGKNSRWNAKTTHNITAKIGWFNGSKLEVFTISFPLIVKRYDTLPLYRQFNEPITKTMDSPDKNILVEYSLPNSSVGPNDELVLYMKISPNSNFLHNGGATETTKRLSFMKKKPPVFKLKKIQFELREVLVCHESGLSSKQTKLLSKQQDFDAELGPDGITTQISFDFPSEITKIISNSSSNAVNSSSQLKKLPLSSLSNNNSSSNVLSNTNSTKISRNSMDGYRPQLTKRLTGGLLSSTSNKRRSLDLRNVNQNYQSLLSSSSSIENLRNADTSFDSVQSDDTLDIKPVPTIQSVGLNHNNKTLTTNTKLLEEVNNGIPITHMQGFTTNGKLFSIKYELVFKVKIHNSNSGSSKSSVKFTQPITVSPYDRIQSVRLLKWIIKEWEFAQFINNTTFQTNFDNKKVNYINSFTTTTSAAIANTPINCDVDFDNVADDNDDEYCNFDTTNELLTDAVFRASVSLNVSGNTQSKNNFFNVSKNMNKYHQQNGNHYYDYSIGALRNGEFESKNLNYESFSKSQNRRSLRVDSGRNDIEGNDDDAEDPYALTIYQCKPFHVYRPQNQMDWKLLGLSDRAIGAHGKSIVHYID
ncbi:Rgl1 protein [Saccharomycopsis crataegensis]|uniref:Rgl1 protein n=1 Tax=Saccharomycopsis crataegensis TaxID=43959 RepID=A0AAV5QVA4_9ASCO|nr:Rgl1 protein [Saccharomycopsis crataegensis]